MMMRVFSVSINSVIMINAWKHSKCSSKQWREMVVRTWRIFKREFTGSWRALTQRKKYAKTENSVIEGGNIQISSVPQSVCTFSFGASICLRPERKIAISGYRPQLDGPFSQTTLPIAAYNVTSYRMLACLNLCEYILGLNLEGSLNLQSTPSIKNHISKGSTWCISWAPFDY